MASAKLVEALATGNILLRKAPRVSGEVQLIFRPLYNKTTGKTETPNAIPIGFKPVDPLKRSDVSMDHIRHSNLELLVRKRAIIIG
jgi:hypothetical protein